MEIEKYRTIETTLDLANDYTPPIRLNAGDIDGRILKFNITDGGSDVDDLNGLKANLTWNRDPTDPASGGGYTSMTKTSGTDNPTEVHRVSFTAPVPRALLLQAGERTVTGIDIEDANGNVIASRNIPVLIDPARLNPKATELADPLKDLHDTIDQAQELIGTASIDLGTVTTLNPNRKATGALTGSGWKRKLNLSIPRGSTISSMTATALDTGTPTVTTDTDTNGDITVALGLPRGKQGEKGDKGDPGDAGSIATSSEPGIVKPGAGLGVDAYGTLSVGHCPLLYVSYPRPEGYTIMTALHWKGAGIYYDAFISFIPDPTAKEDAGLSSFSADVLPYGFVFSASNGSQTTRTIATTLLTVERSSVTTKEIVATVTPTDNSRALRCDFHSGTDTTYAGAVTVINNGVITRPFAVHINGIKSS